ncbi:MAG TPA: AAA family ATPase, partial [Stellaceae bacterium]
MQIDRLRVVGFKSFADAAEVTIGPGLTGIIGPNGCGKSNLAEALRWVMGESSARRLRGGAMDDVIFGGSAGRSARNLAEVGLTIDNRAGDAPLGLNDHEEIEIVRRIERGGGSAWRINGREARARDVQLLFADAASGGSSGSIVGQGRVGALIEARPVERRFLIEDAAGTAGVQARRHETELKLAGAEANLARLDDVLATMTAQLAALKKQVRQAQRYRRLGEQIREHEALVFYARWRAVEADAEARAAELAAAEVAAAAAAERSGAEARARDAAQAALPQLRSAETEAAAELQRLTQARTALEQELARSLAARREAERRLEELGRDHEREKGSLAEADAALTRLAEECQTLAGEEAESTSASAAGEARLRVAAQRLGEAETALQRATETVAAAQAQRVELDRRGRDLGERRRRLEGRLAEADRQHSALAAAVVSPAASAAALAAVGEGEEAVDRARRTVEAAHSELSARQQQETDALERSRRTAAALARLEAEAQALAALMMPAVGSSGGTPLLSAMRVALGFETAIGALFDDELSALFEDCPDAKCFWAALPVIDTPPLPAGAHSFAAEVSVPPALERSLAFAGWVDSEAQGRSLQHQLSPGQRLVDRDGRLWRWDGFTRLVAGPSAAAQQLRHKNRLEVVTAEAATARAEARSAEAAAEAASAARAQAAEANRLADAQLRAEEGALARARAAATELAGRALATEARVDAAADALAKLAAELAEVLGEAEETERQLTRLPQAGPAAAVLAVARDAA